MSSLHPTDAPRFVSAYGSPEPEFTTWKIRPAGEQRYCGDYIFCGGGCRGLQRLALPTAEAIGPARLPSFQHPSDHLHLIADLAWTK